MRKVAEKIIVSKGGHPIYPAGLPVYNCDEPTINPLPGQIVIYDPESNLSLGPGITVSDHDRIVIGVACDSNGDGVADSIRKTFGDMLYGCNIQAATAEPPSCGIPEIHDILFDCTECGKDYSITITREDDDTQNAFPFQRPAAYTYTARASCPGCSECDPQHDCTELVCSFIDQINGKKQKKGTSKYNRRLKSVFNKKKGGDPFKGFTAHRLFPNSIDFCINPITDACDECLEVPAITGISFNGETVNFQQTVNPIDPSVTFQAQLTGVVRRINKALGGNGSAAVTKGVGECCPSHLQINTCFADFQLLGEGGAPIDPCNTSNPFEPVESEKECTNCDDQPITRTFKCGIRIIADPVTVECGCYPNVDPMGYLGRELCITRLDGFEDGATYVRVTQEGKLPSNTGYLWQNRDYSSDNGGTGREHWPFDLAVGTLGLPSAASRANATRVDCTQYCSIAIEHQIPYSDTGVHGNQVRPRGRTILLIPAKDTVTMDSAIPVINDYITSAGCPVKKEVQCKDADGNWLDQDQIETEIDPATGMGTPGYHDQNGHIW